MKKITAVLIVLSMLLFNLSVFAQDVKIIAKSVILDPVDKVIVLTGNINMGGDRTILATLENESGDIVYMNTALSKTNGDFTLSIGVNNVPDGVYHVYLQYRNSGKFKVYDFTGIDSAVPVKINGVVEKDYIFMKDDKNVDSDFNTAIIKLKNVTTVLGAVNPSEYEITGLPVGLSAVINAVSNDTLEVTVSGTATSSVASDSNIDIKLKSGLIYSGLANTSSDVIKGIKLYNSDFGTRPQFSKSNITLPMTNYKTPLDTEEILSLKYRNLAVDGVLTEGVDYSYSSSVLKGLKIKAVANKNSNTIQVTLDGSANNDIKNDITVYDLVFNLNVANGAALNSNPITVKIKASDNPNYVPNYGGGGTGGGGSPSTPSIITPQNVTKVDPIVPIVASEINDISGHWGEAYIQKMNKLGFIKGYEDNTFLPDKTITRAEFVTLTVRLLGLQGAQYKDSFSDVSNSDWYSNQIQTALNAGLISPSDSFRPNDEIKRDEITKIAIEAYQIKKSNVSSNISVSINSFVDADSFEAWSKEYIQKAVNLGIVSGYETGEFLPKNSATRAEAVTILARLIDYIS